MACRILFTALLLGLPHCVGPQNAFAQAQLSSQSAASQARADDCAPSRDWIELDVGSPVTNSQPDAEDESIDEVVPEPAKGPKYKFRKYSNVCFSEGEGYRLLCDIYKPNGEGPFPVVLAIHGGAWRLGSKLKMLRHGWKLAGEGFVVVAINYRLAPEHKFPAQVHDCKHAVRWIRSKSAKLNIDPEQVAVFGYSAGGHLAAMLGTTDADDGLEGSVPDELRQFSSRVQCVVIGGAPCEFSWIKSRSLVDWLGASPQADPQLYKDAAPITYISKDDPPFLIYHGGADTVVPIKTSKNMHAALLAADVDSRHETVVDKGHLATFTDLAWMDDAIDFMETKMSLRQHE